MSAELAAIAATNGSLTFVPANTGRGIFAADSDVALDILTCFLGPTAVLALRHITRRLQPPVTEITFQLGDLSQACGGTNVASRDVRIVKALARLERFGYLKHRGGSRCGIITMIPPLSFHRIERLPAEARHFLSAYQPVPRSDPPSTPAADPITPVRRPDRVGIGPNSAHIVPTYRPGDPI